MAVVVDAAGHAVPVERLGEGLEIARGVLLLAEGGAGDAPGGIVEVAHEREPGPALTEPVVARAVGLEQQALAFHAVTAAAMPWGPASALGPSAGAAQEAS